MIQEKINEIKAFLKSKGMKQKSIQTYCSIITKVLNYFGEVFKEHELESYFTELNLKPRSYNLHRTVMNFYTKKYLSYEIKFTKAKVDKSLPTYVSVQEFQKVIDAISNLKHRMGLGLVYLCGLRIYEVCRVKRHNIDFKKKTIKIVGKGGKHRIVFISKYIFDKLELFCDSIKNKNPHLFQSYRNHLSERSFQEVLKRAIKKARLTKKFSIHCLRHSFAINLLNKGVDIELVRKLLGHSSLRTTQIYLQCRTTDLTKLAMIH